MATINLSGRNKRLEHDYYCMKKLSEMCPAIKWEAIDGTIPNITKYKITFNIRTIVGLTGIGSKKKPKYRSSSTVIVDLKDYPFGKLSTQMVEVPRPYHPNWYQSGSWCQRGGGSSVSEDLITLVIRMAKTIQFDPSVTSSKDWADPVAATWWDQNKNSGLFPCDTTKIPEAFQVEDAMKKIKIHR